MTSDHELRRLCAQVARAEEDAALCRDSSHQHDRVMAARQLPWLRLHLLARHLLTVPVSSPDWPEVEAELVRCAELRRILIAAGWFN